jgi:hypothetical protein
LKLGKFGNRSQKLLFSKFRSLVATELVRIWKDSDDKINPHLLLIIHQLDPSCPKLQIFLFQLKDFIQYYPKKLHDLQERDGSLTQNQKRTASITGNKAVLLITLANQTC